jgi:hypothetical protein
LSLSVAPNRFNSLYGAAQSAEASGDSPRAVQLYAMLAENCPSSDRAEVKRARAFLERHK